MSFLALCKHKKIPADDINRRHMHQRRVMLKFGYQELERTVFYDGSGEAVFETEYTPRRPSTGISAVNSACRQCRIDITDFLASVDCPPQTAEQAIRMIRRRLIRHERECDERLRRDFAKGGGLGCGAGPLLRIPVVIRFRVRKRFTKCRYQEVDPVAWAAALSDERQRRLQPVDTTGCDDDCAICLQAMRAEKYYEDIEKGNKTTVQGEKEEEKEDVTWLPCNHVFHEHCVREWVRKTPSCPLCRSSLQKPPNQFLD